jgi:hypothetical protein
VKKTCDSKHNEYEFTVKLSENTKHKFFRALLYIKDGAYVTQAKSKKSGLRALEALCEELTPKTMMTRILAGQPS